MKEFKVYKINEFVTSDNNLDLVDGIDCAHMVLEESLPFVVYVAGGDNYGNGLEKYKKPHFYVSIEDGNMITDKFRVLIPSLDEWNIDKKLVIYDFVHKDYSEILDMIIPWLDKPCDDAPMYINIEMIDLLWNDLNEYNPNVEKRNLEDN